MKIIKFALLVTTLVAASVASAQVYGHSVNSDKDKANRDNLRTTSVGACTNLSKGSVCTFSVASEKDKKDKKEGPGSTKTGICDGGENKPLTCRPQN